MLHVQLSARQSSPSKHQREAARGLGTLLGQSLCSQHGGHAGRWESVLGGILKTRISLRKLRNMR